ncbi:MAG: DUF2292 domain-containing protein [Candidatus Omnitrophota bacterium]
MNKNRFDKISKSNIESMDKKYVLDNTVLPDIYNAIQEIKYGSVQIHIQDGKVVQIDKVNKVRMRQNKY